MNVGELREKLKDVEDKYEVYIYVDDWPLRSNLLEHCSREYNIEEAALKIRCPHTSCLFEITTKLERNSGKGLLRIVHQPEEDVIAV